MRPPLRATVAAAKFSSVAQLPNVAGRVARRALARDYWLGFLLGWLKAGICQPREFLLGHPTRKIFQHAESSAAVEGQDHSTGDTIRAIIVPATRVIDDVTLMTRPPFQVSKLGRGSRVSPAVPPSGT